MASTPVSAQNNFRPAFINTDLESAQIYKTVEDNHGFIWTFSSKGISRFDGYNVIQYNHNKDQDGSIVEGVPNDLLTDQLGRVWIATRRGLSRYDDTKNRFINYTAENSALVSGNVTALAQGSNGTVLIADTDGLYQFILSEDRLQRINSQGLPTTGIGFIYDDVDKIWLSAQEQGVYALDKETQQIYDLQDTNPWSLQLPFTQIYAMQKFDGSTWIGGLHGIYELLPNGVVRPVAAINENQIEVRDIQVHDNKVWFISSSGIFTMGSNRRISQQLINPTGANHNSNYLEKMLVDRNNVVWLSSEDGAYRRLPYSPFAPRLIDRVNQRGETKKVGGVWSIKQADNGDLWFTSESDTITRMPFNDESSVQFDNPTGYSLWDIVIGNDQSVWLATSGGVYNYTVTADEQMVLEQAYFAGELIDKLYATNESIWLWHDTQGLVKINQATKAVTPFAAPSLINLLLPIGEDALGRLWFNSNMGAITFEPNNGLFDAPFQANSNHPLHGEQLRYLYPYAGHYYAVTSTSGTYKLDKDSLAVVAHTESNVDEVMSAVGIDDAIWYSGTRAIYQVKLPYMETGSFLTAQRFGDNEHWDGSIAKGENRVLFFGGEKGVTMVYPDYVDQPSIISNGSHTPELLQLRVFNNIIEASDEPDAILSSSIYLTDAITLDYKSSFTIEYGVVNPVDARNTQYRIRGIDNTWVEQTNRSASFSSVDFGQYRIEIQSRIYDGEWSPSRVLNVEVLPPVWLHRHALILYAFFIIVVAFYLVRQYQVRKASQLAIRESEERLKLTLWSSGDELWDWDIYGGQVHRSNIWGTLDFPQDTIRTTGSYDANIHENDIERVKTALNQHLDGQSEFYETAYRAKTFKGEWVWILDRGKVVKRDQNNHPLRMTGTLKNIQHLKQAEEQLYLFKRSIENISEGVFITNTDFKFVSVNNAYCNYTGETREKALASYLFFHQYPDAFTDEIKKSLRQRGNWSGEVESLRTNGERFEMELNIDAVYGDDNIISHYVGVFSDITSRKKTEKELLKLANVDPLTDLPNRSFFQASHQNLVRKDIPHTLICLDMDNFKKINDSLGHQTGDILIKQIARRVQRTTGSAATCYRLGGDEFSLLIEHKEEVHTITHFAQSVLDTLSRPFVINKQEFVLSASLGIAFYPEDGKSPQELLKNADTAMYFAKNGGGNSYQFFSGEMNQNAVRQLQIENLIRQGIRDNLFTVFYQPKVDIASGKLVSMEALVRFEHPQKGIVSPNQFIPLAEQTGQIIDIGEQVLRKACEDTKRWVNEGLFTGRVAVNISARQFELPDLDDRIDRILRQVGLSPLHLECELTEGTLMENPEQGLKLMQRLRERGIHLALDDFGTGYSSLAYLKRFPLNTLKIDKAFIDDIAESSVDRHMAAAIINIAHNLGLKVVAEGVEEEKQLSILRRYDCEMLQGYLYSKPLSADKFEKLLKENQKLHQLIGETKV